MSLYNFDELIEEFVPKHLDEEIKLEKTYWLVKQTMGKMIYGKHLTLLKEHYSRLQVDPESIEDYKLAIMSLNKFRKEVMLQENDFESILTKEYELMFPEMLPEYKKDSFDIQVEIICKVPPQIYKAMLTIEPNNRLQRWNLAQNYSSKEQKEECITELSTLIEQTTDIDEKLFYLKQITIEYFTKEKHQVLSKDEKQHRKQCYKVLDEHNFKIPEQTSIETKLEREFLDKI